jgi:hypothetical protein
MLLMRPWLSKNIVSFDTYVTIVQHFDVWSAAEVLQEPIIAESGLLGTPVGVSTSLKGIRLKQSSECTFPPR